MIERARHQQIRVRIEALRERTTLMVQIALYLKLHVARRGEVARLHVSTELVAQAVVRLIRYVSEHAREHQSARRIVRVSR